MGTRQHGPKSQVIFADAASGASIGTIPGVDGATAIKAFLMLAQGTSTYGSAAYLANYWATASEADGLFEVNTKLILETRSISNTKAPVSLGGQTIAFPTTSAVVQFGQQLTVAANGTVAPSTAPGQRLFGLAMNDAGSGEPVGVVTSGLWYGQIDDAAIPARNVDCTTDASSRVVAAVSTDVANAILMSDVGFTILGRLCRIFQVSRPIILA